MSELQSRPKIKIQLSNFDKLVEVAGWIILVCMWIYAGYQYAGLPEIIPVHFNAAGKPDSYGVKEAIFLLPFIGTIMLAGLTALNKYPHIFNYPVKITHENAARQYTQATRMIRVVKLAIVLIFIVILYKIGQSAHGNAPGLGSWFLPVIILIILLPLAVMSIMMFRNAGKK